VPESRPRKKDDFTAPATSRKPVRVGGRRWIAPAMVTLWVLGLAWIVVYYLAGTEIDFVDSLGGWNLLIGMGLIAAGFVFATKWE